MPIRMSNGLDPDQDRRDVCEIKNEICKLCRLIRLLPQEQADQGQHYLTMIYQNIRGGNSPKLSIRKILQLDPELGQKCSEFTNKMFKRTKQASSLCLSYCKYLIKRS